MISLYYSKSNKSFSTRFQIKLLKKSKYAISIFRE